VQGRPQGIALEEGLQFAPMGLAIGGANIFFAN